MKIIVCYKIYKKMESEKMEENKKFLEVPITTFAAWK
jgi:hypothetical protein